jgi:hypothetical protein
MLNSTSLCALNGLMNARSMRTVDGSVASVISIRPCPALRLPDQE